VRGLGRYQGRVGQDPVDHRAQIARPLPPQRKARDRIAVDPVVAGVVDRGSDLARAGQRGAEPSEVPTRSAGAVRQHDRRESGRRGRECRIDGGAPAIEQRIARRTEQLRLLLRARISRIQKRPRSTNI
jgi:hypothetical protein